MTLSGFLLGFKLQLNIQSEWQLFPLIKSPQELEDLDLRTALQVWLSPPWYHHSASILSISALMCLNVLNDIEAFKRQQIDFFFCCSIWWYMIKGALRSNVLPMEIGCKRLLNTADQQNNIPGAHALVPSLCNTPYTVLSILTAHIFLQETDRTEVLIPLHVFVRSAH